MAITPYQLTVNATKNLVARWKLDETSGTTATDDISGLTGTLTHGAVPGFTALIANGGNAVDFDGADDYITVPFNAIQTPGTLSYEVWFQLDTLPSGNAALISTRASSGFKGLMLFVTSAGNLSSVIGDGTTGYLSGPGAAAAISTGTIYHAVLTFDGTTWKLYLNGVFKAQTNRVLAPPTSAPFIMGCDQTTSNFIDGRLDEVAIYSRDLTLAEITTHYNAGIAVPSIRASATVRGIRPLQVVCDGQDITRLCESVEFSNTDPGGFEAASIEPKAGLILRPGSELCIRRGLDYAFHGRVLDPGEYDKYGKSQKQLSAVGYGHALNDNPFSMIYVDRDLGRWGGMSRAREKTFADARISAQGGDVSIDVVGNLPSITQQVSTPIDANGIRVESFYDAGQGNLIAVVYIDMTSTWDQTGATTAAFLVSDDAVSVAATLLASALRASTSGYLTATPYRWALLQTAGVSAVTTNTVYTTHWRNVAMYGDHGLTRRGDDPGGFFASDIVAYAAMRSGAGFRMMIDSADSYVIPHAAYYEPTGASQQIGDATKQVAWHWGVWEPGGAFDSRPTFLFTPPPADATLVVDRYACDEFEAPRVDYDKVYNVAQVKYSDPAGSSGFAEVSLPDARLDASGVQRRVLSLDMGTGSLGAAQAFGIFALRLAQRSARTGGSITIKGNVRLPNGGTKPAELVRSGRDRIRILGLRDGGELFSSDTRALDSFLVRRVESTATPDGAISTRIDFDQGVDLLEVLQARLSSAATIAGQG